MEGLHLALKDAVATGLLRGTNVGNTSFNILHLFYADDVVIISDWNMQEMDNIIRILHVFYLASGLKLNIYKPHVYGLNMSLIEIEHMACDTRCSSGNIPFSYPRLLIGSNMNLLANWHHLIDRFCAKLSSWKANFLSIGVRLTLIKVILGSIGIYYMSIFKCPETTLKRLESIRASFFWGGSRDKRKMALIKWDNSWHISIRVV
ncbi:hypothetical protein Tco_1178936 [Tanacetum coccineum]